MWGWVYLLGFFCMWVLATTIAHRDDDDAVSSVLVGFLAAMLWPITLVGVCVWLTVRKLERVLDAASLPREGTE